MSFANLIEDDVIVARVALRYSFGRLVVDWRKRDLLGISPARPKRRGNAMVERPHDPLPASGWEERIGQRRPQQVTLPLVQGHLNELAFREGLGVNRISEI
jgi:hypothetical protein